MNTEELSELVYYSESSPTGLRWSEDRFSGRHLKVLKAKKGSVAGSKCKSYYEVCIARKKYWAHRVVWTLVNGLIVDKMSIDHIDGDGFNNKITNLREVTHRVNLRNQKKRSSNTTGVTGVCVTCDGFWKASWQEGDKEKSKKFSVNKYGYEEARELAIKAREGAILGLNLLGFGYSERHGND